MHERDAEAGRKGLDLLGSKNFLGEAGSIHKRNPSAGALTSKRMPSSF